MPLDVILFIVAIVIVAFVVLKRMAVSRARRLCSEKGHELGKVITQCFPVEPCSRCGETRMDLIEVSPNARSIHHQCTHCGKKTRTLAGRSGHHQANQLWSDFLRLRENLVYWTKDSKANGEYLSITLVTVESPLPYEQTKREPIPKHVRLEIWRRDGGKCVQCGSNQNLQFDHIIPVSKGGATTAQNLQILCRQCNLSKGAKI